MSHPTEDKNFRLSREVLPRRYVVTLDVDLEKKAFSGTGQIELALSRPTSEVVLHANGLTVERAVLGGQAASAITPAAASETVILRFAKPAEGNVALELSWNGKFCDGLRGLYLAGKVAVTQFEAADARRVFPCFDEPAFKAKWAITLKVQKGLAALSNGRPERVSEENGKQVIAFSETEVLASYLIALAIGDLASCPEERCGPIPVRTWALPNKVNLTGFGQEVAMNVLPRLQDYFGLPYAFGKLDQVGVPDFEAGAMENAGLITYREVALMVDPQSAPLSVKKRIAEVVTHELAHQWFGNWVTMKWWDDLWLNEAFATWMAYKIVDPWKPEWRIWLDFDMGKARALGLDALRSTHPIRGVVRNAEEAGEAFDLITYEKGGATLRMIESYLGEAKFRDGIRSYMKEHARANAEADDLWRALETSSKEPVLELANAWIRQSGFPLVGCELEGGKVSLTQRRFYSQPGVKSDETWPVPVVLRYSRGGKVAERRVLFREARAEVRLEGQGEVDWLCANAGSTGFYRVAYGKEALARLSGNVARLAPAERVGLLSDTWALVRAGEAEIGDFLGLASKYGGERDYAVLDELVGALSTIEHRLVADADRPALQKWVAGLFGPILGEVGWQGGPESDEVKLRRASAVRGLALVGREPAAVAEAGARVKRLVGGDKGALEANLLDAAVAAAARAGDVALFDALLERLKVETDPATKRRYLVALAMFEGPALVQRAQDLAFTDTVPMQDISSYITVLLANRATRDPFFATMQNRWPDVLTRTGNAPMLLRRVIEAMGGLIERSHLNAVRAFLKAHPVDAAKQATDQTLERLEQDVVLRERTMAPLGAWLKSHAR